MRRILAVLVLAAVAGPLLAAQQRTPRPTQAAMLTIDSIMRGPKLVGNPPTAVRWSKDSSRLFFSWQKADAERASTWEVRRDGTGLRPLTEDESRNLDVPVTGRLDRAGRRALSVENGDVVITDVATGSKRVVMRTGAVESNPRWARRDTAVTFVRGGNLFLLALESTADTSVPYVQLTDIVDAAAVAAAAAAPAGARGRGAGAQGAELTEAQKWLRDQERALIDFIRRQADERDRLAGRGRAGAAPAPTPIARFTLAARQTVADLALSADEQHVYIGVNEQPDLASRGQDTPNYVTESSFPEMIAGRANVGDALPQRKLAILDVKKNAVVWAEASTFAGEERTGAANGPRVPRVVNWGAPDFSDDGARHVIAVTARDNKDRWLVSIDPASGRATVLDHLHDDAWIRPLGVAGGAGGAGIAWLPDNETFLFLSEKTGWMHLYALNTSAPTLHAKPLTTGAWEVTSASLSKDRSRLFLQTNAVHLGERHFYTLPVSGGEPTRITTATGSHDVTVSPDERTLAVVHSYSTRPPELHVMPFTPGAALTQVTTSPTEEWRTFKWIDPKVITYKSRDGKDVPARLYTPEMIGARRDPKKPAVIFVHGAGYLQNAHRYWSTYYREFMFHNLLASQGYVVLDPDYRASSGYGRDWRTAIYRHMGGHDLNDVVDGAKFLVATERVDPRRIGVYGGSYGGFITLMAMFTTPDVFAAGAALRPVTDWSHYNHGYTSNILNTPLVDPEAFKKSSPIYFAEGLKGRLLIAHGMVDTNVFFQDSVRLAQRLIELRKDNWEIAPYPVENHAFTEETSWADEYKRILRLFDDTLKK